MKKKLINGLQLTIVFFGVAHVATASAKTTTTKKALVTGITGQDGAYLAELLLDKGYQVHGIKRRSSSFNTQRIDHLYEKYTESGQLVLHYGDMTDSGNLLRLIEEIRPDEIYNLAAQSHVGISFEASDYTANVDALGPLRILEAIRCSGLEKTTKFYQASTSELYGKVVERPQTEKTPFYPRSPYGVAKLYGFWITQNYREAYGMYACNGILFNHESPLRGANFVTRKITLGVAEIMHGLRDVIYLGNLDASRDWGYAKDYVEAMWLMLQQDTPEDFVIATGQTHTVREFVELAFSNVGIEIAWRGSGINEIGVDKATGKERIKIDPKFFRPAEVDYLCGDPSKAMKKLGWQPKTTFEDLAKLMVEQDLKLIRKR